MTAAFDDGYDGYYAERLWQLLPGVYRSLDSASVDTDGPLRELVDRIGAQVAVVRRSIDRLWADQSIETCDDWVIPYLGDLLGTNSVNALDVRGQRLDVANTIHYRRRKGTVEVLEELAYAMTGQTAHVVEGFRLLARNRHGLDPGFGAGAYPGVGPAAMPGLLAAEGLVGAGSGTPAGGYLDLRDAHAASLVDTPFDEAFHHFDARAVAHFGIEKLLVFLWRLRSFTVAAATPVLVPGCAGLAFGADPTGRQVPLFLPAPVVPDDFAGSWTSAGEWQVPGRLTASLASAMASAGATPAFAVDGAALDELYPELGRFSVTSAPAATPTVAYSYAFASTIGAGPYDRDLLGDAPVPVAPVQPVITGGGAALATALATVPTTATVVVGDSLTYATVTAVGSSAAPVQSLLCQAGPQQRPVIRVAPAGGPWTFTGGPGAELVLDGLLLSGCDLILRGAFASVRITGCTLDPGTAAAGPLAAGASPLATAIDGVPLVPTRIFVEADPEAAAGAAGALQTLVIDHCVVGPIRTRYGGAIETLSISDTIVQAIPISTASEYSAGDVYDPVLLAQGLLAAADPLAAALLAQLPASAQTALTALHSDPLSAAEGALDPAILAGLNALVDQATPLYDPASYPAVALDDATLALAAEAVAAEAAAAAAAGTSEGGTGGLSAADLTRLNRRLLDAAFPVALGLAAIAVADAVVGLQRTTVIGAVAVHQLSADDSILTGGVTVVDDLQAGCVRFSAVTASSRVPRQYRCARLAAGAAIFTSADYGDPGYAQLLEGADRAIVGGSAGASLVGGAETGSEMGAFSADMAPVNEQAMQVKFAEYMPLGLTPVVVHVT